MMRVIDSRNQKHKRQNSSLEALVLMRETYSVASVSWKRCKILKKPNKSKCKRSLSGLSYQEPRLDS